MLHLELPYLPPAEFSPNSRVYWTQRHSAGRKAKDDIWALVHAEGWQGPALKGATVTISWGLPTKKTIDWDNLIARMKPLIDGLVEPGLPVGQLGCQGAAMGLTGPTTGC
jgi:hypothetical protein